MKKQTYKEIEDWYNSPEGKASTQKAWEVAQEASRQLKEECEIKPEHLEMWIGI